MKEEVRTLGIPLTDDEIIERSKELSEKIIEKARQEIQKSDAAKAFKAVIDDLDVFIGKISHEVASGERQERVACVWELDAEKQCKYLIRTDTGEEIERTSLTDGEWQESLTLQDKEYPPEYKFSPLYSDKEETEEDVFEKITTEGFINDVGPVNEDDSENW